MTGVQTCALPISVKEDKDPCWKGYEMIGMKKKGGRKVPNCVPANEENLAELSTAKMAKYIEPAYNSARDLTKEAGYHKANADDAKHHGDRKDYDKHMSRYRKARDKVDNREVGISRAASKIAKRDIKMRKAMGEEYGLYRKGGSVGEKDDHPRHGKLISKHATPEEAKGEAKAHNKTLSAGEKKYYRMKYHVKPMKEETLDEKAPPGAKFERMVKHIKKGYSKDGLTSKEKSIAFATAWKAKNREKGE